ncbi:hypothetical protein F5Y17DRAFT_415179, partial [Xylariaceae sp. FL0594]
MRKQYLIPQTPVPWLFSLIVIMQHRGSIVAAAASATGRLCGFGGGSGVTARGTSVIRGGVVLGARHLGGNRARNRRYSSWVEAF